MNETDGSADSAYISISAWEAGEETNLVTDGDTHVCRVSRGSSGGDDTAAVTVQTWTTDATHTITIEGNKSDGYGFNDTGVWDTSFYVFNANTSGPHFSVFEQYVYFDGIQFEFSRTTSNRAVFYTNSGNCDYQFWENCIFKDASASGTSHYGIWLPNSGTIGVSIKNCLFYDFDSTGSSAMNIGADETYVYNNLLYNCTTGITIHSNAGSGDVLNFKNNIIVNCGTDLSDSSSGATVTFDYNATDDPASGTGDPRGTNGVDMNDNSGSEWDDAFTDRGSEDFTIKSGGPTVNVGVANATDSEVPTTDYLGNSRVGATDIGPFELQTAAASSMPPPTFHRRPLGQLLRM